MSMERMTCTTCKIERPLSNYKMKYKKTKSYRNKECRDCVKKRKPVIKADKMKEEILERTCKKCNQIKSITEYKKKKGYLIHTCRACYNERKSYRRRIVNHRKTNITNLKFNTLMAYMPDDFIRPHCICCKEDVLAFLTLDHTNGGGSAHRRTAHKDGGGGGKFYAHLKKLGYPTDPPLQVLCFNCNIGRSINNGICPHQIPHAENISE